MELNMRQEQALVSLVTCLLAPVSTSITRLVLMDIDGWPWAARLRSSNSCIVQTAKTSTWYLLTQNSSTLFLALRCCQWTFEKCEFKRVKVSQLLMRNEKVPVTAEPEPVRLESYMLPMYCRWRVAPHRIYCSWSIRTCTHRFFTKEDNLDQF